MAVIALAVVVFGGMIAMFHRQAKAMLIGLGILFFVIGLSGRNYKEPEIKRKGYEFDYSFAPWTDANDVKHWGNWRPSEDLEIEIVK